VTRSQLLARRHTAVVIRDDLEISARIAPALRGSLAEDRTVLVAVRTATARTLRLALGSRSQQVRWLCRYPAPSPPRPGARNQDVVDTDMAGIEAAVAAECAAGRSAHLLVEPDLSLRPDGQEPLTLTDAYLSHEVWCQALTERTSGYVTCLWDHRQHPPEAVLAAVRLHTWQLTPTGLATTTRPDDPRSSG
jgi:hypothetical protein